MNCPKCGAQILPGAGFCGGCGYRLEAAGAPQATARAAAPAGGFAQAHGIHIDAASRGMGSGYK